MKLLALMAAQGNLIKKYVYLTLKQLELSRFSIYRQYCKPLLGGFCQIKIHTLIPRIPYKPQKKTI